MILPLVLALAASAPAWSATPDTALLTYESGVLVAADWVQRRGRSIRTTSMLMQSGTREATIETAGDGAGIHASTVVWNAGESRGAPIERDVTDGRVFWSDQIPSTIDQVVQRARAGGEGVSQVAVTSLYRDSRALARVERIDATDWVVVYGGKHYDVLTDSSGEMLAATLPDYGVTIERRTGVVAATLPPWPRYAAAPGASYRADSVRIVAPEGHALAGTLTLPPGRGPVPAAVLVTGISPHERNNGDPPYMPFRDLADALSRAGIAVLRVDDRGVGRSTGDRASSTTFDEVADVHTEIAWLRARPGIDRRRVFVIGLSEGGLIAPMVAATDSALAGIVTLAGPGVSGPEVARYQTEAAVVRDTSIAPAAREAEIQRQLADTLNARERSFMSIDPLAWARRVRCPALIVHGGSDLHVPPRSAERLAWAMRSGGNRDVTVHIFPGLSHTLLPDPIGLASGWAALPGFMTSPDLLRAVTEWTSARVHGAPVSASRGAP